MYWPKLHSLRACSVNVTPSTAAKFFKSHPTLSNLQIVENTNQARFIKDATFRTDVYPIPDPHLTLLPGSLPNLKYCKVPNYISEAIDAARRET